MEKEIWKEIVYDGETYEDYQVSNLGRVKSLKFRKERILRPSKIKYDYLRVNLCKNGKHKAFLVHRLVAESFIPNPENKPEINHIDENKTNNSVKNLEWCDREYNNKYGTHIERISKKTTNGKLSKSVLQFTLDGEFVKEYPSTMECGRNGFNQGKVVACCRGERKTHKGYIWKYK